VLGNNLMNDKLEIEYEHLSNGYWKGSFILSSEKLNQTIMDSCSSFHTLDEAKNWMESEVSFLNIVGFRKTNEN
jgi:hypothetical protein